MYICWARWRSRYSDWLRAVRFRDRIQVGSRFSAPVQTGPGAHPASCTMGTGYFPGVRSGRGVTLTPQSLLVPWSRKGRAIPLLPLWAVWPVQSLSACTREQFSFLPLCLRVYKHAFIMYVCIYGTHYVFSMYLCIYAWMNVVWIYVCMCVYVCTYVRIISDWLRYGGLSDVAVLK